MARRRNSTLGKFFTVTILVLVLIGGYTLYKTREAQNGIKSAEKTAKKVERVVRAAEKAWR